MTFNGDLRVLGSRWSGSWWRLVRTDNQFLFVALHFRHVVRLLLNMQLYLDLERSAASIRRQCPSNRMTSSLNHYVYLRYLTLFILELSCSTLTLIIIIRSSYRGSSYLAWTAPTKKVQWQKTDKMDFHFKIFVSRFCYLINLMLFKIHVIICGKFLIKTKTLNKTWFNMP